VRLLGVELGPAARDGLSPSVPGPGLGVRILGEVKREYAELLRRADAIFIEELRRATNDDGVTWYDQTAQAFAVFLPVRSVGVMGDGRTYDFVVALRAVQTTDFMTAHWAELPYDLLGASRAASSTRCAASTASPTTSPRSRPPPSSGNDSRAFLSGAGHGRAHPGHDWQASPLGDPARWPQALKTLVPDARLQAADVHGVGSGQTWLYNDAFVPILGAKHPARSGVPRSRGLERGARGPRPLFGRVFAGEPVHMDDFGLMLDRNGRLEEAHFAFSYTPVRDESGPSPASSALHRDHGPHPRQPPRDGGARAAAAHVRAGAGFVCMLGGPSTCSSS
jgi:hypothetical protein